MRCQPGPVAGVDRQVLDGLAFWSIVADVVVDQLARVAGPGGGYWELLVPDMEEFSVFYDLGRKTGSLRGKGMG